ncbi:MAG: DUF4147 domain-containing protein, partial [Planctomycetota bacterium]
AVPPPWTPPLCRHPPGTREIGSRREISNLIVDEVRPIGSNEPTRRAVQRTGEMMRMLRTADSRTLVIALISGGGSALMSQPVAGITLDQMLRTIRVLSAAGADITDLNTVRKQIDCVKGGGLRANFSGQHFVSLVISDVLGDPLDVIASGPTVSNSTGPDDALRVLKQFDQQGQIPETIYHAIDRSIAAQGSFNQASVSTRSSDGELPCHPDVFVLANNATAVDAAGVCAERLGMGHVMQTQRADAFGDEVLAENVGRRMAEVLLEWSRDAAGGNDGHRVPNCLITGGEPVVQLCPESQRGRGGRNQQLVLAAMHRLSQSDVSDEERNRIVVLSGGTDGEDGPTDAAGAVLDAGVWQRYRDHANVLSIEDALRRNDAHTFFQRCGGLLITGPTHTNVCDLRVGLI